MPPKKLNTGSLLKRQQTQDVELRFWRASIFRRYSDRPIPEVEEAIERARASIAPSIDRTKLTKEVKRSMGDFDDA